MNVNYVNGLYVPRRSRPAANSGFGVEGWIECTVINAKTKQIVRKYPRQHNLILNYGLDQWCNVLALPQNFLWAVVGTGTTVTSADSTPSTAAQAGTTVTVSGGTFTFTSTGTDTGRMIKWDSGEEARVVTVTDPTHAEVTPSQSVSANDFNYFYTNQTSLTTETKRTATYLTTAGGCDKLDIGSTRATWRTYDFSAEAGNITYNEIGFSNASTPGANLWARIKLASPIALVSGQQLRVKYTVNYTVSPITATAVASSVITGWPTASGYHMITNMDASYVLATGASSNAGNPGLLEPNCLPYGIVSQWTGTWPTFSFGANSLPATLTDIAQSTSNTLNTYIALDFRRDKTYGWTVNAGNATNINCINITSANYYSNRPWAFKFDANQTKDNTHTLSWTLRVTVSRVLA